MKEDAPESVMKPNPTANLYIRKKNIADLTTHGEGGFVSDAVTTKPVR